MRMRQVVSLIVTLAFSASIALASGDTLAGVPDRDPKSIPCVWAR